MYHLFVAMLHITVVQYEKGDKHKMCRSRLSERKVLENQYKNLKVTSRHCHVHNDISGYLRYSFSFSIYHNDEISFMDSAIKDTYYL